MTEKWKADLICRDIRIFATRARAVADHIERIYPDHGSPGWFRAVASMAEISHLPWFELYGEGNGYPPRETADLSKRRPPEKR